MTRERRTDVRRLASCLRRELTSSATSGGGASCSVPEIRDHDPARRFGATN